MPLSVSSFAVPPVEMISMWYYLSSRDNSSTPFLWETLISARRMVVMECGMGNRAFWKGGILNSTVRFRNQFRQVSL
jgi:hypothetical protein